MKQAKDLLLEELYLFQRFLSSLSKMPSDLRCSTIKSELRRIKNRRKEIQHAISCRALN